MHDLKNLVKSKRAPFFHENEDQLRIFHRLFKYLSGVSCLLASLEVEGLSASSTDSDLAFDFGNLVVALARPVTLGLGPNLSKALGLCLPLEEALALPLPRAEGDFLLPRLGVDEPLPPLTPLPRDLPPLLGVYGTP